MQHGWTEKCGNSSGRATKKLRESFAGRERECSMDGQENVGIAPGGSEHGAWTGKKQWKIAWGELRSCAGRKRAGSLDKKEIVEIAREGSEHAAWTERKLRGQFESCAGRERACSVDGQEIVEIVGGIGN